MISVLLPARDASATLDAALESLRSQRLQPARVVVVDDGSVDSTEQLLEQWRGRWDALEIVRTAGLGIAGALNRGLERCLADSATKWVARMDADDRCHAERFARQHELAAADSRLALVGCEVAHTGVVGGAEGMRRHVDWANSLHEHDELALAVWIDSPLPHPSWLVRREAFERVGGYDASGTVPEDYEWLQRFFAMAREREDFRAGKCLRPALVDWVESPGRLTRVSPAYSETAFNRVKANALARLLEARPGVEARIFGMGPKGKALLPELKRALGGKLRDIVDVNPRKTGMIWEGLPVLSVEQWVASIARDRQLVLFCLGTPEARSACEKLCHDHGLEAFRDFIAL